MIIPIPRTTDDLNSLYEFFVVGSQGNRYRVKIVIDDLNDCLLLTKRHLPEVSETSLCSCKGMSFKTEICKHMREVLDYLKSNGIEYRIDITPVTPYHKRRQMQDNNTQNKDLEAI